MIKRIASCKLDCPLVWAGGEHFVLQWKLMLSLG